MLACIHIVVINENEAPRKVFRARKGEVKKRREKVAPSEEFHDLALREISSCRAASCGLLRSYVRTIRITSVCTKQHHGACA